MKYPLLVLAAVFTFTCSVNNWRDAEFQERTGEYKSTTFKYRIFVPPARDPNVKVPVMLFLHGSGARGDDNREQIGGIAELIHELPQNFPYAVVLPQCPAGTFWTSDQIEKALAALDRSVAEINGDPARLYLAGYSMGGFGAWHAAIANRDKFAAMISIAGGVEALGVVSTQNRSTLSAAVQAAEASGDVYRAYGEALKNLPIWIVHGEKDESVPVEQSRKLSAALRAAGSNVVNYKELANDGHAILEQTFRDEKLAEWLKRKTK